MLISPSTSYLLAAIWQSTENQWHIFDSRASLILSMPHKLAILVNFETCRMRKCRPSARRRESPVGQGENRTLEAQSLNQKAQLVTPLGRGGEKHIYADLLDGSMLFYSSQCCMSHRWPLNRGLMRPL
jgi:hypothetical protein